MKMNLKKNTFKKKKTSSPLPKPTKSSRIKSKKKSSRSNSKSKKFNPSQYLKTLIQLTNKSNGISIKRSNFTCKRDLSCALTIATPAMEKSISSTIKIRSRSSYSQHRKKANMSKTGRIQMKDVLKVNLDDVVTEQDNNIKFTMSSSVCTPTRECMTRHQSTFKSKYTDELIKDQQDRSSELNSNSNKMRKVQKDTQKTDFNLCATMIQRAWRSYQTYKMVKKYHKHFKRQKKIKKEVNKNSLKNSSQKQDNLLCFDINKQQLDLTQKLKKVERYVNSMEMQHSQVHSQCRDEVLFVNDSQNCRETLLNDLSEIPTVQLKNGILINSSAIDEQRNFSQKYERYDVTPNYKNSENQKSLSNVATVKLYESKKISLHGVIQHQTQKYNEILYLLKENSEVGKSNRELLSELLKKFEENKNFLEKDIEDRLSPIELLPQVSSPVLSDTSRGKQEKGDTSPQYLCFDSQEILKSSRNSSHRYENKSSEHYRTGEDNILREEGSEDENQLDMAKDSFYQQRGNVIDVDWDYEDPNLLREESQSDKSSIYSLYQDQSTKKIYDHRLKVLEQRKFEKIQQIEKLGERLDSESISLKIQQIEGRFNREKSEIVKNKTKYQKVLRQVKNEALQFQKSTISSEKRDRRNHFENRLNSNIRKSFSAESIVLKCILADPQFVQYQGISVQDKVNVNIEQAEQQSLESESESESTLSMQDGDPFDLLRQTAESSIDARKQNESLPKIQNLSALHDKESLEKFSEDILQMIEKQLIEEYIEEIYLNQNVLKLFKPFVEEIFEFTQLTDRSITEFIVDIQKHYPSKEKFLQKANQKINPSSIEILRLIRDYEYEIDEYELILAEQIFKKSRKDIENEYGERIEAKRNRKIKGNLKKSFAVIEKMNTREAEKRQKIEKYINYERDLKIMYMKAVFNCFNQFLIEEKSLSTHMNSRSTISAGQLTLAIKQFNFKCTENEVNTFFQRSQMKIRNLLANKCMIPSFKNFKEIDTFQRQMLKIVKLEIDETEYKWVNFMDQVLEIWNQLSESIIDSLYAEAVTELILIV